MTTVSKLVEESIRADGVVREALARGFVNYRALAEWLIKTYELDASVAAVMSAVRRHEEIQHEDAFAAARRILRTSYVNTRMKRSRFIVPNTRSIHERLPSLLRIVDYVKGETIRILSFERGFKVVLDEPNFQRAVDVLGKSSVSEVRHGLVELSITTPPDAQDVPGIYALLANAIALRGISIEEGWISYCEQVILVRERDLLDAYEALSNLTTHPRMRGTAMSDPLATVALNSEAPP